MFRHPSRGCGGGDRDRLDSSRRTQSAQPPPAPASSSSPRPSPACAPSRCVSPSAHLAVSRHSRRSPPPRARAPSRAAPSSRNNIARRLRTDPSPSRRRAPPGGAMTAPPGSAAIAGDDLDVRRPTVDANRASPRPPRARDAHLFRRRVARALVSFTFASRRPRVLVRPRLNSGHPLVPFATDAAAARPAKMLRRAVARTSAPSRRSPRRFNCASPNRDEARWRCNHPRDEFTASEGE